MLLARPTSLLCTRNLSAFLFFLFLARASAAQLESSTDSRCSIDGSVVLEVEQRPAEGVVVAAKSLPDGASVTVLTDDYGTFHFHDLPPGTYEVFAEEPGGYESPHITTRTDQPSSTLRLSLKSPTPAHPPLSADMVSVRELRIPQEARAAFEAGVKHLREGQAADSLTHFRKAIDNYADYYEAYYCIGLAHLSMASYPQALEALQKAIDLSGGKYSLAQFATGVALWRSGNPAEAAKVLRNALESDPSLANGHLYLSVALYDLGRLQEAEKSARAAVLRNPKLAITYLVLARIYARWGNAQQELQNLEKYLALEPNDPQNSIRNIFDSLKSRQSP